MNTLKHRLTVAAIASLLLLAPACNKKEEGTSVNEVKQTESSVQDTILAKIPAESFAFATWDTKSDAYKKFRASAWGKQEPLSSYLNAHQGPQLEKLLTFLRQAGVNVDNPQEVDQLAGEGVAFAALPAGVPADLPPEKTVEKMSLGTIVRPQRGGLAKSVGEAIRNHLKAEKYTVNETVKLTAGEGFGFSPTEILNRAGETNGQQPPQPKPELHLSTMVLGWNDKALVVGSSKEFVDQALADKGGSALPAVLTSAGWKKAAAQLPASDDRYSFGFVDTAMMLANPALRTLIAKSNETNPQGMKPEEFPVDGIAFASGFTDSPIGEARVFFNPRTEGQKQFAAALGKAVATDLFQPIPAKPLIVLALDGSLVQGIVASISDANQGAVPGAELLKTVNGAALSLKSGGIGQSLLPLPDALLVVETSQPKQLMDTVTAMITPFLAQAQAQGMTWSDKTIEGTPTKALVSPMGFSLLLATKGNMVVAASTEPQMGEALKAIGQSESAFLSGLKAKSQEIVTGKQAVGGLYLDFVEVGGVLENMGGLLEQFAPGQAGAPGQQNDAFSKEKIAQMKRLGAMVSSVTFEGDIFVFRTVYDRPGVDTTAAQG